MQSLSVRGLALGVGVAAGLIFFVLVLISALGLPAPGIRLVAAIYPGLSPTLLGAIIAGLYGLLMGLIKGALVALLYNLFR